MPNAAARRTTRRVLLCPFADTRSKVRAIKTRNVTDWYDSAGRTFCVLMRSLINFGSPQHRNISHRWIKRRTLGTTKDSGPAIRAPGRASRTSPTDAEVRQNRRPSTLKLSHQHSGPLAGQREAIPPLWLSIALFTRSKTVIGADLRACSPSSPGGLRSRSGGLDCFNTRLFHNSGSMSHTSLAQRLCWAVINAPDVAPNITAPRTSRQPACQH
jgi:hypothetical protein